MIIAIFTLVLVSMMLSTYLCHLIMNTMKWKEDVKSDEDSTMINCYSGSNCNWHLNQDKIVMILGV